MSDVKETLIDPLHFEFLNRFCTKTMLLTHQNVTVTHSLNPPWEHLRSANAGVRSAEKTAVISAVISGKSEIGLYR